nr:unnamed protein product [Digitaria exilis]
MFITLARSAPGRSSAATWPASGGGPAELAEPRRWPLPSLNIAVDRPPRLAPRERHHGGRSAAVAARAHALQRIFHSLTRQSLTPNPMRALCPSSPRHQWRPRQPAAQCLLARPNTPPSSLTPSLSLSPSPRARSRRLQPRAARTEPSFEAEFALHSPPFPNSLRTKLDPFTSLPFPHSSRAVINSPARNRDFPQISIFWPPEHPHVEPLLRAIPEKPRRPRRHCIAAGRFPSFPRPPNCHQSTRGEPLVLSPHFPDPISPSLGRRNSGDEPRTFLHQGVVADGFYHLIPANGEGTPENGAGEGTVDPEANPQLAQEGKPRSIT